MKYSAFISCISSIVERLPYKRVNLEHNQDVAPSTNPDAERIILDCLRKHNCIIIRRTVWIALRQLIRQVSHQFIVPNVAHL